ncbi:hypothetical protein JCM19231_2317 [Vibrio ishigakensis]|uniref:Lipoprotein n=1 Tax=Vibrio ishigakensis TaxID=1481914 RepID=A0A0B8P3Q0_9VIBR|nr:hypothetical protein [Vibrio ishigakensis]GAM59222.1 hypothetical protein JCM19231_2317 [Vibrio ishigakensis]
MKYLLPLFATFALVGCDDTIDLQSPNTPPSIENPIPVDPDFGIPIEGEEEGVLYYYEDEQGLGEFTKNGIVVATTNMNLELIDVAGERIGTVTHWNRDSEHRPVGFIFTFDQRFYFDGQVFEPKYQDGSGYMEYHTDRDVYDGAVTIAPLPFDH